MKTALSFMAAALLLSCAGKQEPGRAPSPSPRPSASAPAATAPQRSPAAAASGADSAVATPEAPEAPALPPASHGRLARSDGSKNDAELALGDEAYDRDELLLAKKHFEQAKKLDPKDPAAELGLLRVALAQSGVATDYGSAPKDARIAALLKRCDALLAKAPQYGLAHVERGRLLLILGRAEPALEALQHALTLVPGDAEAQSALGVALIALGRASEALTHFRRASEVEPSSAERLTNLGTVHLLLGQVGEAVTVFERAVNLSPGDARVHSDLGTAYLTQNRAERAVPELKRAVELDPARATFRSNLAYAYELAGQLDLAVATAREAIQLDPKLGSAWLNLGTALAKKRDYAEAERAFNKAQALDPTDPRPKANLADLHELRNQRSSSPP